MTMFLKKILCFSTALIATVSQAQTDIDKPYVQSRIQWYDSIMSQDGVEPLIAYNEKVVSFEEYLNINPNEISVSWEYPPSRAEYWFKELGKGRTVLYLLEKTEYEPQYIWRLKNDTLAVKFLEKGAVPPTYLFGNDSLRNFIQSHARIPDDFYDIDFNAFIEMICYFDKTGNLQDVHLSKIMLYSPIQVEIIYANDKRVKNNVFTEEYESRFKIMEQAVREAIAQLPPITPGIAYLNPVESVKKIHASFLYNPKYSEMYLPGSYNGIRRIYHGKPLVDQGNRHMNYSTKSHFKEEVVR